VTYGISNIYTVLLVTLEIAKHHFTFISGFMNLCMKIINNVLILPQVTKPTFKTLYLPHIQHKWVKNSTQIYG